MYCLGAKSHPNISPNFQTAKLTSGISPRESNPKESILNKHISWAYFQKYTTKSYLFTSVFSSQTSVDDVVMLLKQQENFEKTLTAQDEKLHSLSDMANSLVKAGHRDRQWYDTNTALLKILILLTDNNNNNDNNR